MFTDSKLATFLDEKIWFDVVKFKILFSRINNANNLCSIP